jgi:hypothetical protein
MFWHESLQQQQLQLNGLGSSHLSSQADLNERIANRQLKRAEDVRYYNSIQSKIASAEPEKFC